MQALYNSLMVNVSDEYKQLAPSYVKFARVNKYALLHRVSPTSTLSLSVTGKSCGLNCSHCEGHYLKGMADIEQLDQEKLTRYKSVLISGGSSKSGRVPIKEKAKAILELPANLVLNFHVGYQTPDCLNDFAGRKLIVSFDLPSTDEAILKVFHLPYKACEYQDMYLSYAQKHITIPHMTIGLSSEADCGEENTIDFLFKNQPKEFVIIVFRPTKGTSLENMPSPSVKRVIELLKYAQDKLECPVKIGCMRPSGKYRQNIDTLAWMHGIRSIVHPHRTLIQVLEQHSVDIINFDECCALSKGVIS